MRSKKIPLPTQQIRKILDTDLHLSIQAMQERERANKNLIPYFSKITTSIGKNNMKESS